MAATHAQINDYLLDTINAQSDYGKKVALHCRLGRSNLKTELISLSVLGYYIRIMEKYFNGYDYENHNFFTEEEAKDIMEKINSICKTFIYLDI